MQFLSNSFHPGLKGDFDPNASHNGWVPMNVPSAWEQHPNGAFADTDGFGWYRSYVHVPEAWRGSRLLLVVDEVSDVDEGFFNGIKIGANGAMPPLYQNPSSNIRRPFVIDPDWIRYGEDNLIAWRVYDKGGQGGILKGPVHLSRRDDAIDLQGTWLFRPGDAPSWSQWDHDPDSAEAKQASCEIQTNRRSWVCRSRRNCGRGHRGKTASHPGGLRKIQRQYQCACP